MAKTLTIFRLCGRVLLTLAMVALLLVVELLAPLIEAYSSHYLLIGVEVLSVVLLVHSFAPALLRTRALARSIFIGVGLSLTLILASNVVTREEGAKKFSHRFQNGSNILWPLYSASLFKDSSNYLLRKLPPSTAYIVITAVDTSRVMAINNFVDGVSFRFCYESGRVDCVGELLNTIENGDKLTVSGRILLVAVIAKKYFEIRKEGHTSDNVTAVGMMNSTLEQCRLIKNDEALFKLTSHYETKKISPNRRKELTSMLSKFDGDSPLTFHKNLNRLAHDSREEAYALELTIAEITKKFVGVVVGQMKEIQVGLTVELAKGSSCSESNSRLWGELKKVKTAIEVCGSN